MNTLLTMLHKPLNEIYSVIRLLRSHFTINIQFSKVLYFQLASYKKGRFVFSLIYRTPFSLETLQYDWKIIEYAKKVQCGSTDS